MNLSSYPFVMNNYLNTARENELAFRKILEKTGIDDHENLSLEIIYEKYSTGNRTNSFTILDFVRKTSGDFEFTFENIGPLSGIGKSELWRLENEEVKFIETTNFWMS